jgi:hypothetical protein
MKVNILNPERLPWAKEQLMNFLIEQMLERKGQNGCKKSNKD